jgi:hypothetical protein
MRGSPAVERVSAPAHARRIRRPSPRRPRVARARNGFSVSAFLAALVNAPRDTSPIVHGPLRRERPNGDTG